jgi:putative addiction module component (TIGR02574 family)
LTQAQNLELDRRLADHLANPDDVIAWDDVKEAALRVILQN